MFNTLASAVGAVGDVAALVKDFAHVSPDENYWRLLSAHRERCKIFKNGVLDRDVDLVRNLLDGVRGSIPIDCSADERGKLDAIEFRLSGFDLLGHYTAASEQVFWRCVQQYQSVTSRS